jgi:hypothetical protein
MPGGCVKLQDGTIPDEDLKPGTNNRRAIYSRATLLPGRIKYIETFSYFNFFFTNLLFTFGIFDKKLAKTFSFNSKTSVFCVRVISCRGRNYTPKYYW